jgi:histidinol-phosphatase (PHP family)
MIKCNLHTHSIYSDGKNTPDEIVQKAIDIGFTSIGFSEHADDACTEDGIILRKKDYPKYFALLDELKDKYSDKIKIYKGLELDAFSYDPEIELDYSIGSIHFLKKDNKYYAVDESKDDLKHNIEIFGGEKSFLINYFDTMISFAKRSSYNILGHFDLYTKYNSMETLINTNGNMYRDMATNALEEIVRLGKIVEINTGAISRGYKTTPYPQDFLIKRLIELKAPIILSSDSHSIDTLDYYFSNLENTLQSENIINNNIAEYLN